MVRRIRRGAHPLKSPFHMWHGVETLTSVSPWQKKMLDDIAILFTFLLYNLRIRNCLHKEIVSIDKVDHVGEVTNQLYLSRGIPVWRTSYNYVRKLENGRDWFFSWNLLSIEKLHFAFAQILHISNLGLPKHFWNILVSIGKFS